MPPQAAGDVREDGVAVLELDPEGRARKDLLDDAEDFDRRFLYRLGRRGSGADGGRARLAPPPSWTAGYGRLTLLKNIAFTIPHPEKLRKDSRLP